MKFSISRFSHPSFCVNHVGFIQSQPPSAEVHLHPAGGKTQMDERAIIIRMCAILNVFFWFCFILGRLQDDDGICWPPNAPYISRPQTAAAYSYIIHDICSLYPMARFIVSSFRTTQINISSRITTKPSRGLNFAKIHLLLNSTCITSREHLACSIRFVSFRTQKAPSQTKIEIIYDLFYVSLNHTKARECIHLVSCLEFMRWRLRRALRGRRLKRMQECKTRYIGYVENKMVDSMDTIFKTKKFNSKLIYWSAE